MDFNMFQLRVEWQHQYRCGWTVKRHTEGLLIWLQKQRSHRMSLGEMVRVGAKMVPVLWS